MAVSTHGGSFTREFKASFEGLWRLIEGRFRADPYKSSMAASTHWWSFLVGVLVLRTPILGVSVMAPDF